MTFDISSLWGLCLLASPILVLLLTAWAYARAEAMATARPEAEPINLQPVPRVGVAEPVPPPPGPAPRPIGAATPPPTIAPTIPAPAGQAPGRTLPAAEAPPATPAPGIATPAIAQPAVAPPVVAPPAPAARKTEPRPPAPPRSIPVTTARAIPPLPELPRPPFPKAPPSAAAVSKSLTDAEAAGNTDAIPDLKVALGMAHFREGRSASEAANDVRAGLILALQQGQKLSQGHARIALGDLCKASDDLTTACEHWQLARDIFAELKDAPARKDAETRIRANGCPTDWVLNEF